MKVARAAKKAGPRAKAKRAKAKRAKAAAVVAKTVESEVPFLEVVVRERVTEDSMVRLFEEVRVHIMRHTWRRVFVDMRASAIDLTPSDMMALAKLVAGTFAGQVERLTFLMRPEDIPAEKFFEPSVNSRGVPTLVTSDLGDALHFLTAKLRPLR